MTVIVKSLDSDVVTTLLRLFEQQNILGQNLMVIGTNALYAYEAAAGVFFEQDIMATSDMDILRDTRPKLVLVSVEKRQMGGVGDLEAVEVISLQWLLSSPKFSQTVIGDDGFPALMVVPDPRAFSLHKLWLSKQEDRDPMKRSRDQRQGITAAKVIFNYLTQYKFTQSELRMFPADIVEQAGISIKNIQMPSDFD